MSDDSDEHVSKWSVYSFLGRWGTDAGNGNAPFHFGRAPQLWMQRPPQHPGVTYTSVYRVEDPELVELLGSLPQARWKSEETRGKSGSF